MSNKNISSGNPLVVVAASGFFNPLHSGHIKYLQAASDLGDILVVIVNNDDQVRLKYSVPFVVQDERMKIVQALTCVDTVVLSIDKTFLTVPKTLKMIGPNIFANGGDRTKAKQPEKRACDAIECEMVFGVGGITKEQSSSNLLDDYYATRVMVEEAIRYKLKDGNYLESN